jgi:hypothetical protein
MARTPPPDQQLDESNDVNYTEPPKSIALYIDATKWIVGLATGSFLLTGSILTSHPDSALRTLIPVWIAIIGMTVSAGFGVLALQCYTRLANLIEVHFARKAYEVRAQVGSAPRMVSAKHFKRCKQINCWLTLSNIGYGGMTYTFALGVLCYLDFARVYLFTPKAESPVTFTANATADSPVLGLIHDDKSKSDCVVVRTSAGVTCRIVTQSGK